MYELYRIGCPPLKCIKGFAQHDVLGVSHTELLGKIIFYCHWSMVTTDIGICNPR